MRYRCRQNGSTLIEALITAVIIGTAMLGIAALQIKTIQASTNAAHRAQATDIAWGLAERMRSNLLADTSSGNGNAYISAVISSCPSQPLSCAMAPGADDTSGVTQCAAAQMATFDLWETRCANNLGIKRVLPNGSLAINCDDLVIGNTDNCDPGSELLITITWSTRDETLDTGEARDFITMTVIPGGDLSS